MVKLESAPAKSREPDTYIDDWELYCYIKPLGSDVRMSVERGVHVTLIGHSLDRSQIDGSQP